MEEEVLAGGNASGRVIRIGETVRKPWVGSSTSVQNFLALLHGGGGDVPRPVGRDEDRRQVIEYIDGAPAMELPELACGDLARVGQMIRRLHDLSAEVMPDIAGQWDMLLPIEGADLSCSGPRAALAFSHGLRCSMTGTGAIGTAQRSMSPSMNRAGPRRSADAEPDRKHVVSKREL